MQSLGTVVLGHRPISGRLDIGCDAEHSHPSIDTNGYRLDPYSYLLMPLFLAESIASASTGNRCPPTGPRPSCPSAKRRLGGIADGIGIITGNLFWVPPQDASSSVPGRVTRGNLQAKFIISANWRWCWWPSRLASSRPTLRPLPPLLAPTPDTIDDSTPSTLDWKSELLNFVLVGSGDTSVSPRPKGDHSLKIPTLFIEASSPATHPQHSHPSPRLVSVAPNPIPSSHQRRLVDCQLLGATVLLC